MERLREEAGDEADVVWLGYCQVQPQVDRLPQTFGARSPAATTPDWDGGCLLLDTPREDCRSCMNGQYELTGMRKK